MSQMKNGVALVETIAKRIGEKNERENESCWGGGGGGGGRVLIRVKGVTTC